MVLETGIEPNAAATVLQQRENHSNAVATVEDELEPGTEAANTSDSVLFDKAYQLMEKFASTRIGQYVLERGDRVLRIIEDTAKWSLPDDVPLARPLSWLPFLMLIIFLRQLRIWLSLGALLIGDGPVTAHDVVYFIQTRRRKLRSIRVHGIKAIQQREQARKVLKSEKVGGVMVKLGQLFTIAMCRPRINCEPAGVVFAANKAGIQELLKHRESPRFTYKRQREDDEPEAELSCSQLLSKYANESSEDDSDYVPIQEEEDTNNESTQSAISSNDTQGEYSLDTSDENAKDLNLTEKVESKDTKPPKVEKVPAIEINAGEKENNSVSNKINHNDKNNAGSLEVAKSAPKSPKSPHTPLENGPKNSNEKRGVAVVVQTGEGLKAQKEHILDLFNGHVDVEKKSTPGHETAADTKPLVPPPLLSNVVNAITPDPFESSDGNPVDAIDDCFANQIEIPNVRSPQPQPQPLPVLLHQPLHTSLSSPSCSTTSSTSSLASFETSNEQSFLDDGRSDPPTPTPSLNEASSTEDIYLSPFGSPPNFNAFHNPVSSHKSVVTFGATEEPSTNEDEDFPLPKAKQFKPQPERKTQQQQKHSHQQRYRRNRRS